MVGDAADAVSGEHRLLDRGLPGTSAAEPAADLAVLALGVLADDDQVDRTVLGVGRGIPYTSERAERPQVDVLAERAADRDQQAPQGHVIGHVGPSDGAEQHRVVAAQRRQPVRGHQRTLLEVALAGPVELVDLEPKVELRIEGNQYRARRRGHFDADAVTGDERDAAGLRRVLHDALRSSWRSRRTWSRGTPRSRGDRPRG